MESEFSRRVTSVGWRPRNNGTKGQLMRSCEDVPKFGLRTIDLALLELTAI
jgi:hypothetical protein